MTKEEQAEVRGLMRTSAALLRIIQGAAKEGAAVADALRLAAVEADEWKPNGPHVALLSADLPAPSPGLAAKMAKRRTAYEARQEQATREFLEERDKAAATD